MSRPRTLLGALGAWETLRFLALFVLVISLLRTEVYDDPRLLLWLILIGSAHLPLIAAILIMVHDLDRYGPLLPVIRLAKIVEVLVGVLTLMGEIRGGEEHVLWLTFLGVPLPHRIVLLAIAAVDVGFLGLLATSAVRPGPRPSARTLPIDERPLFRESDVEDPGK